jgi:hypothetical protein
MYALFIHERKFKLIAFFKYIPFDSFKMKIMIKTRTKII